MDSQTQELILSIKDDMREDIHSFRDEVNKRFDTGEQQFKDLNKKIDSHIASEPGNPSRLAHPAVVGGSAAGAIIAVFEFVKTLFFSNPTPPGH